MLRYFRKKRQGKLNSQLSVAITWDDTAGVRRLLLQGADPNALLTDRERALDLAIERAGLATIEALLEGGADPLIPYTYGGRDYRPSEVARLSSRPIEIVERLEQAECEAGAERGSSGVATHAAPDRYESG